MHEAAAVDACFTLLHSLQAHPDTSRIVRAIQLDHFLSALRHPDTPLALFMARVCNVDLEGLCRELDPRRAQTATAAAAAAAAAVTMNREEFAVVVRILCSAAQRFASAEKVIDLLHVTVSLFVTDCALELSRSVKNSSMEAIQKFQFHDAAPVRNNNVEPPVFGGSPSPPSAASSPRRQHHSVGPFVVDIDFVKKLTASVAQRGTAATAQRVLRRLQSAVGGTSAGDARRAASVSKEVRNIWAYALSAREAVGGMDDATRQELVGAALEVSGQELFPHESSVYASAELALRAIVGEF